MKKSLLLLVLVFVITGLAACSQDKANDSKNTSDTGNSAVDSKTPVNKDAGDSEKTDSEKPVTIKILHYMGNEVKISSFTRILEQYQTLHPNVTFDSQAISQNEYITQLRTRIASGDPPDIMMGQPSQYPDIIETGYIMDLTGNELLTALGLSDADIGDASYNGKPYAVPLDFKTYGIIYNKDIFTQYNLKEPTTQDELDNICDILAENGVDPWARSYSNVTYPDIEARAILWPLLQENGNFDAFEKLMSGEAKFADYPEFEKAMELWTRRMKHGRMDDNSNDITASRQLFASGEAAMIYEGTWAYAQIAEFGGDDLNIGMFVIPRDDGKENQYCIQLDQLFMINGKSEQLDATMDFMKYFLSPEVAGQWTSETTNPVVVPGVELDLPEVLQVAITAKEEGNVAHAGYWTAQLNGEFLSTWRTSLQAFAADGAVSGKFDIPAFTESLQSSFDQIIKSMQ